MGCLTLTILKTEEALEFSVEVITSETELINGVVINDPMRAHVP